MSESSQDQKLRDAKQTSTTHAASMPHGDAPVPADAVKLTAAELPAFCPNPKMPIWSSHPRVFLDVATSGAARCPYCGTFYALEGPAGHGH